MEEENYSHVGSGPMESEAEFQQMANEGFVKVIQEFIKDVNIPPEIVTNSWGILSKHLVLGNINKDDEETLMRDFYNMRDIYYNSIPTDAITTHMIQSWKNLEIIFKAILTRARAGGDRERSLLATQIRQTLASIEQKSGRKRGFFGRLFGGGKK